MSDDTLSSPGQVNRKIVAESLYFEIMLRYEIDHSVLLQNGNEVESMSLTAAIGIPILIVNADALARIFDPQKVRKFAAKLAGFVHH
ncbi:hypothetical protein Maq22A_c00285 [Methylobacterium aquaticum]|uniref:Uncharacterized protein n=1 Tax=Methylobacterium aquaticum TaxID=270351 RepID=A0A0C6EU74_9HYPH|nr:hypothetical protein Maq22A_c00285 [Methylobacterium aquaticum]